MNVWIALAVLVGVFFLLLAFALARVAAQADREVDELFARYRDEVPPDEWPRVTKRDAIDLPVPPKNERTR